MTEKIFQNTEKVERAKDIIALVSGKKSPKSGFEENRKETFTRAFKEHAIDIKAEDVVEKVYLLLAGKIISHEEAKKIEERKVAIKSAKKVKKDEEA